MIIIVIGSLGKGGAEVQALFLAIGLKRLGYQVQVFAFHDGLMRAEFEKYEIKVTLLDLRWDSSYYSKMLALYKFRRLVRKKSAKLTAPFTLIPNVFSAFSGVRCIWNQRDEGIESFSSPLEKLAIRRAASWVANSEGGSIWVAKNLGCNSAIQIIRNGVSLDLAKKSRDQWRSELGAGVDQVVVTMVGNLSKHKDHITLIHAWSLMQKNLSQDVAMLVLAGRLDDQAANIMGVIRNLNLQSSVIALGAVEDIAGLLSASDIFVLSSRSEGLSNAVIEAAQTGLPILGSNIPGIRECLPKEHRKYLSAPGDSLALSKILSKVISSQELWPHIGNKNKSFALTEFSRQKMLKDYDDLIKKHL